MTPDTIKALADAYEAGALAVHDEWVAAHCNGEEPPRGDPDFSEAANDYARSIPTDPLASDRAEAVQQEADYVMVPREPTEEMWAAWRSINCNIGKDGMEEFTSFTGDYGNWVACYNSMIAAAPVHPRIDAGVQTRIADGGQCNEHQPQTLSVPFNECLAKLRPGEPFFVLLGRDAQASAAVINWVCDRERAEGPSPKLARALDVAVKMANYAEERNGGG